METSNATEIQALENHVCNCNTANAGVLLPGASAAGTASRDASDAQHIVRYYVTAVPGNLTLPKISLSPTSRAAALCFN